MSHMIDITLNSRIYFQQNLRIYKDEVQWCTVCHATPKGDPLPCVFRSCLGVKIGPSLEVTCHPFMNMYLKLQTSSAPKPQGPEVFHLMWHHIIAIWYCFSSLDHEVLIGLTQWVTRFRYMYIMKAYINPLLLNHRVLSFGM